MRQLSSAALRAMFGPETGVFPIMLLTIDHEILTAPIRVSSDATQRLEVTDARIVYGTVSRGQSYIFMPFEISLPSDAEDSVPTTTIRLDNVGRDLTATIRSLTSPPSVTMELVMSESLDTVEATFPDFEISPIGYDDLEITGTLTVEGLVNEPYPAGSFTPGQWPGLFR